MPVFLDTRGRSSLGIAICGRCSRKFPIDELYADPNVPGLRVCRDDLDHLDPYRLPPRATEDITLRFPRPDTPLAVQAEPSPPTDTQLRWDQGRWDETYWS